MSLTGIGVNMGRSQRGWVGELERVARKKGYVWYVRLRIPRYDGGYLNTDRKLGMVWEGKAPSQPGYLTKRQAEEQRQLLAARYVWGDERAPAEISNPLTNTNGIHFTNGKRAECWKEMVVHGRCVITNGGRP